MTFDLPPKINQEKPSLQLSPVEAEILIQVTEADKEKLRAWRKTDLILDSDYVVAVRSEDILYFIKCVHQGYFPVGGACSEPKVTE